MRDWLTIELVLALLLVTSFTSVGLLALWAATSPRHWFVRVMVVLGVLSPLLLIPAYELFIAFTVQAAVTVIGVGAYRWWKRRRSRQLLDNASNPSFVGTVRFSLSSVLLLTVLAAIATPIAVRLPALNFTAWASVLLIGAAAGLISLLSLGMANSRRKLLVWPIGVSVAAAIGAILNGFDEFVPSVLHQSGWPPPGAQATIQFLQGYQTLKVWLIAAPATTICLTLLILLCVTGLSAASADETASRRRRSDSGRRATAVGFFVLLGSFAAFPLYVFWQLLNPLPVPRVQLPNPNGYARLVDIGKRFDRSTIGNLYDADPIDYKKLSAAVAAHSSDYGELAKALEAPCWIPIHYDLDLDFESLVERGWLARALVAKGKAERHADDNNGALTSYLQILDVADAMHHGGVAIDFLVATAIEQIALEHVYELSQTLDAPQLDHALARIADFDGRRENVDDVLYRERVWSQRAYGWVGLLVEIIGRFDSEASHGESLFGTVPDASRRATALTRLLTVDLAIRSYHLANDRFPDSLDELVSIYLVKLPTDPFATGDMPFRYRREQSNYLLYSVGKDGDDDGGRPPAQNEYGATLWDGNGDLRLDVYFASDDDALVAPQPAIDNDAADLDTLLYGDPTEGTPTEP